MLTDFQSLRPDDTLEQAVEHILSGWQQDFPVVFGTHLLGVLTREDLMRSLAGGGTGKLVRDAMRRNLETVDSHDMLEQAVQVLHRCGCRSLPVQHNGELVGMLALENVGEFMMIRSAMRRALHDKGAATAQPELGASRFQDHRKTP